MLPRKSSASHAENIRRDDPQRIVSGQRHHITLKDRKHLAIEGVTNVESFDQKEIIMETVQGVLCVRGTNLQIKELDLKGTGLLVTGYIDALEYHGDESGGSYKRGMLSKLFR